MTEFEQKVIEALRDNLRVKVDAHMNHEASSVYGEIKVQLYYMSPTGQAIEIDSDTSSLNLSRAYL